MAYPAQPRPVWRRVGFWFCALAGLAAGGLWWAVEGGWPAPPGSATAAATASSSTSKSAPISAQQTASGLQAEASKTAVSNIAEHSGADVREGAYLAVVGNCAGCHTAPGGAAYAGGRAIPTPFGNVYAGNLTPDADTGLGRWTADEFWRALHEGRSRDGRRLIPAFPYTAYTHLTRQDSDRLFAYLRSLPPVHQAQRPHELRFPFGTQPALAVWQWLSFSPAPAEQTPTRKSPPTAQAESTAAPATDPMARGAYLVQALGHCAECHAPRNRWGVLGAEMTGGVMPGHNWYTPSLHPSPTPNSHRWTAQDLVDVLRTGRHRHGSASGPMAGVVFRSTQYWTEADLQAAAAHLLALPKRPPAQGSSRLSADPSAPESAALGQRLYADQCAECHGDQGQGTPGLYSPLAGNPSITQPDIRNLVQMLQHGGFAPATQGNPRPFGMPPQELSVAETTAVLNHLRQSWGHRASLVTDLEVTRVR
jgi:mono/diheme cytochrome c family protein